MHDIIDARARTHEKMCGVVDKAPPEKRVVLCGVCACVCTRYYLYISYVRDLGDGTATPFNCWCGQTPRIWFKTKVASFTRLCAYLLCVE